MFDGVSLKKKCDFDPAANPAALPMGLSAAAAQQEHVRMQ